MTNLPELPTGTLAATTAAWSPEQAQQRLARFIAEVTFLSGAEITPLLDMHIASRWYAFSVLPSTGLAGETIFLLSPDRRLSSGRASDFDALLRELDLARDPSSLDAETFGNLFVRFRLQKRGFVIDDRDDPILELAPELRSSKEFSPPRMVRDNGLHYCFWIWDSIDFTPRYFDVAVAPDGTTTY